MRIKTLNEIESQFEILDAAVQGATIGGMLVAPISGAPTFELNNVSNFSRSGDWVDDGLSATVGGGSFTRWVDGYNDYVLITTQGAGGNLTLFGYDENGGRIYNDLLYGGYVGFYSDSQFLDPVYEDTKDLTSFSGNYTIFHQTKTTTYFDNILGEYFQQVGDPVVTVVYTGYQVIIDAAAAAVVAAEAARIKESAAESLKFAEALVAQSPTSVYMKDWKEWVSKPENNGKTYKSPMRREQEKLFPNIAVNPHENDWQTIVDAIEATAQDNPDSLRTEVAATIKMLWELCGRDSVKFHQLYNGMQFTPIP